MINFNDLIFTAHNNNENVKRCRIKFTNKHYISVIGSVDKNEISRVYGDGEETFELWTSELEKSNKDVEAYIDISRVNNVLKEFQLKYGKPTHMNDMKLEDYSNTQLS